ncbi:MAG: sugar phosphate permease, partial [Flavobacteriales bacterium]
MAKTAKKKNSPKKSPTTQINKKYKRLTWLIVLSPILGLAALFINASFADLPKVADLA